MKKTIPIITFTIVALGALCWYSLRETGQKLYDVGKYQQASWVFLEEGNEEMLIKSLAKIDENYVIFQHAQRAWDDKNFGRAEILFEMLAERGNINGELWVAYKEFVSIFESGDYEQAVGFFEERLFLSNTTGFLDSRKLYYQAKQELGVSGEPGSSDSNEDNEDNEHADIERVIEYLETIGYNGSYTPSLEVSLDENISALQEDAFFWDNPKACGELIGKNRLYQNIENRLEYIAENRSMHNSLTPFGSNVPFSVGSGENIKAENAAAIVNLIWCLTALPDGDFPDKYQDIPDEFILAAQNAIANAATFAPFDSFYKAEVIKGAIATALLDAGDMELLEKLYPSYFNETTLGFAVVNADDGIKDILLGIVPIEQARQFGVNMSYTLEEYNELLGGFIPSDPQRGGYIRIIEVSDLPNGITLPISPTENLKDPEIYHGNTRLFAATNPNNAHHAIYERFSVSYEGKYRRESTGDMVDVYMPVWSIRVVDLTTGESILEESQTAGAEGRYEIGGTGSVYCPWHDLSIDRFTAMLVTALR